MSWQHPLSPPAPLHPISVVVGPGEVYLGPYSILPHLASPGGAQCSPASRGPYHTSDSDLTDCESEASQPSSSRLQAWEGSRFQAATDFAELLQAGGHRQGAIQRSPFKRAALPSLPAAPFEFPLTPQPSDRRRSAADAAYDLTDDNFAAAAPEKLSTFRKKRLAEKKYEFTDEEENKEQFVPLTRLRSKKLMAAAEAAGRGEGLEAGGDEGSREARGDEGTREAITEAMASTGRDVMVCVSERGQAGQVLHLHHT